MFSVRPLLKSEIPQLEHFPPKDWNMDLCGMFSFHFGYPYFYPLIAEVNKKLVGCGIAILHGTVSWLGTIIVLPEYRRQGIGKEITCRLIEHCRGRGCKAQLLIASEMGEPLYRKLGFAVNSTYFFYKSESNNSIQQSLFVRKVTREDKRSIKELDREITGEERFAFLERFLSTGLVYAPERSSLPRGIYLPDYSSGLILARDAEAGLELMKVRLAQGKLKAVVPSVNSIACEFLTSNGYQKYRVAPRMFLGNDVQWQPTMLYNRGSGYCG